MPFCHGKNPMSKDKNNGFEPGEKTIKKILDAVKNQTQNFSYYFTDTANIKFYSDSAKMCEMNACGRYKSNWACPPAAPEARELFFRAKRYKNAALFTLKYDKADDYDWEAIEFAGKKFNELCRAVKAETLRVKADALVLGAGACDVCESCSYPDAPCRSPELIVYPLEAAGIDASSLPKHGDNVISNNASPMYTGLLLYN